MGDDNYIPKRLGEYRERAYWDRRYASDDGHYDWLLPYARVKAYIGPHVTRDARILNLGCGNSRLAEEMWTDGYTNIANIDYSEPVITAMRSRTEDLHGLEWHVMDMRHLAFSDASFDVILDKGSLDAVWTDGGSVWQPAAAVLDDIRLTVDEILRVLRKGGVFVSISFGQPHFRRQYLERDGWTVTADPIPDTFYFVYTARKHEL